MSMTTVMLLEHLQKTLDSAPERARADADLIRQGITAYHDLERRYRDERQGILADPMKSDLAKRKALESAAATFKEEGQRAVQAVKDRVERTLKSYRTKATPLPLSPDAALNEARLGNARSDAAMVLGSVPREALTKRMKELAQGTEDEALRYLLLTTEWPKSYLESRGARGSAADWDAARAEVLPSLLDDEGRTAHEALSQLQGVAQVSAVLESSFQFFLADNGLQ